MEEAVGPPTSTSLHMSDVIEVLQTTEPDFGQPQDTEMFNSPSSMGSKRDACVKIIEQPASKALRFRYECEGRSAGSIPGATSTPENKTFPTIQVVGYQGRAVVVVSCVTKDVPYRPHPHNLVGKEGCKKGICSVEISGESMTATFSNLGIQCVKKKDIDEALRIREGIRVDPFHTGFSHRSQPTSIDLNAVRLCFQVFLEGPEKGKFTYSLPPVVSDPIYDKKAMCDLVICKLSDCSASVAGGRDIILLCEKVAKEDIQVRFFTEEEGRTTWEGLADFTPASVHKQVAISFRTPRYRLLNVDRPVNAFIQLRRPSDGACSEALPFTFTPLDDPKRKRPKQLLPCPPESSQPALSISPYQDALQPTPLLPVKTERVTENPAVGGAYQYKDISPIYSPQHPPYSHDGRTPSPRLPTQQWPAGASIQHGQQTIQLQPHQLQPRQQKPQPQMLTHHAPSSTPEFPPQQYSDWSMAMASNIPTSNPHNLMQPTNSQQPSNPLLPVPNHMGGIISPTSVHTGHGPTSGMAFHPLRLGENFTDLDRRPSASQIPANASNAPLPESGGNSNFSELESILFTENLVQNLSLSCEDPQLDTQDSLSRYLGNSTAHSVNDLNHMLNN